jgi:hypothetical protein
MTTPNPWHLLHVDVMMKNSGPPLKYGVVDTPEECTCTPEDFQCPTLRLYFAHRFLPGALPNGSYRMRANAFGLLEVQTPGGTPLSSASWRPEVAG